MRALNSIEASAVMEALRGQGVKETYMGGYIQRVCRHNNAS